MDKGGDEAVSGHLALLSASQQWENGAGGREAVVEQSEDGNAVVTMTTLRRPLDIPVSGRIGSGICGLMLGERSELKDPCRRPQWCLH